VAEIVQPHVPEARAVPYETPGLVDVPEMRPRLPARYDPGAVVGAKEVREKLDGLRR